MKISADDEGKRLLQKITDTALKHDVLGGEAIFPAVIKMKQCLAEADEAARKEKKLKRTANNG